MKNETYFFGDYLRELRTSHKPIMTQEQLATAIGRTKMTISQFEQKKNDPPQGELLEKIICALDISVEESNKLRFLAAMQRKMLPGDIESYFFSHPCIYRMICLAQKLNISDEEWNRMINMISKMEK